MVDKKKVGKGRLDKYYYLAKEQGYRARSAFKLVQLNHKYHFLENARVLVDLCAAPGGWLQVASKYMPLSRHIIGVDLDPIKPIPGVKTFVSDITSEKCRSEIKKELATWKADVILHDGAPNVGSAWCKDAYNQAELVLMSLKLACEFLIENGTFVTKVFRSKDYNSLLWVFNQLFKKVESTKPASSRNVSAEIFVYCSGYLAPKKIDPKLFDSRSVFEDIENESGSGNVNVFKPEKRCKQRNGYEDGITLLYKKCTLADFVQRDDPMVVLSAFNTITYDDDESKKFISLFSKGFELIKDSLADLKVLGKSDLKHILRSRLKIRKLFNLDPTEVNTQEKKLSDEKTILNSDDELEQAEHIVSLVQKKDRKDKKKKLEMKNKQRIRMQLGMTLKGDSQQTESELELFKLKSAPNEISQIPTENYESSSSNEKSSSDSDESSDEEDQLSQYERELDEMYQSKMKKLYVENGNDSDNNSSNDENESGILEIDEDEGESEENSLIVKDAFAQKNAISTWFDRPEFKCLSALDDDDEEDENITKKEPKSKRLREESTSSVARSASVEKQKELKRNKELLTSITAIDSALTLRDHDKEELIDNSFNRYAFDYDDSLPLWFVEDEKMHNIPQKPISKEAVEILKQKMKSITSRPLKKVREFNMRQKLKNQRKLEGLKKKAFDIADSEEMNDKQKLSTISKLISKNKVPTKRPSLVIAKGYNKAIKGRPKGVKGKYKMVDARMKKELKAKKRKQSKK